MKLPPTSWNHSTAADGNNGYFTIEWQKQNAYMGRDVQDQKYVLGCRGLGSSISSGAVRIREQPSTRTAFMAVHRNEYPDPPEYIGRL